MKIQWKKRNSVFDAALCQLAHCCTMPTAVKRTHYLYSKYAQPQNEGVETIPDCEYTNTSEHEPIKWTNGELPWIRFTQSTIWSGFVRCKRATEQFFCFFGTHWMMVLLLWLLLTKYDLENWLMLLMAVFVFRFFFISKDTFLYAVLLSK